MKNVQTSNKTLIPAYVTSNMYRLNKTEYQNLLRIVMTTTYKKTNKNIGNKINKEGIKFVKKGRYDKIEMDSTRISLVTLKDHKENFINHSTTWLINPSKNEIGNLY